MKGLEAVLEVASFYRDEHKEVYAFIEKNQEPTYRDTYSDENLYSVDVWDNLKIEAEFEELPKVVEDFVKKVGELSRDIAYIRFI